MTVHAAHLDARLAWLRRFRVLLASREAELSSLIVDELHKTRWEALTADVTPVLASARWHERHARRVLRARPVRGGGMLGLGQAHRVERRPLGRVAIIATWNYPVGLLGVQLIQAVIAGNRVTVKPSEHAPRSQAALLGLARDAGLRDEDLAVTEPTREAGRTLLHDHAFDHVVFTGSTGVGRAIAEVLAPTLTTSTLELSGRDSALVLADADPKLAAKSVWYGVSVNGGQTCISPKRALVHQRVYAAFLRELGLHAAGATPRRLISEDAARVAADQLRDAIDAGGRALTGVFEPAHGPWIRPQAVADCPPHAALVDGRNFAPTLAVVPCRDEAAMLEVHNRCDQHLATCVFTRAPHATAQRLGNALRAGAINFNDCVITTGHPGSAIGGIGASGWGRSRGEVGLLDMTRAVTVTTTSRFLRIPLDTPPAAQAERLARFTARCFGARFGPSAVPSATPPASTRSQSQPRAATAPAHRPDPVRVITP